jgi:hypothetical protein
LSSLPATAPLVLQLGSLACSASPHRPLTSSTLFEVESSTLFDVESSTLFEVESSTLFDVESSVVTTAPILGKPAGALSTDTLALDGVVATVDSTLAAGVGAIVGRGVAVVIAA